MKVLCIQGSKGRITREPVIAGQVYEVVSELRCCKGRAYELEGQAWLRPGLTMSCDACGRVWPSSRFALYNSRRFIPWNPNQLGITSEEVNRLYNPKEKEHEKAEEA